VDFSQKLEFSELGEEKTNLVRFHVSMNHESPVTSRDHS